MIHSILLLGQSNMGGRGYPADVEPIENEDASIKVLRCGRWHKAYCPMNADRVTSGVNLAESFAVRYRADHPDVTVGIIGCAAGGTNLDQWRPGLLLYDHAIAMARLAQRTSNIVAVLWHQGESDCHPERYPDYERKLLPILRSFRRDLGLEDIPFLLGGLGDYLQFHVMKDPAKENVFKNYVHINAALQKVAAEQPHTGFVSAEGLTSNPDFMHFNAKSLRAFGDRYYDVFRTMEDKNRLWPHKPSQTELEKGEEGELAEL